MENYLDTFTLYNVIIPLAAFGCVAAIAWLLLDRFSDKNSRASERLDQLRDPRMKRRDEERYGKSNKMAKAFEQAVMSMAKPL
jgi:hypothetical protein